MIASLFLLIAGTAAPAQDRSPSTQELGYPPGCTANYGGTGGVHIIDVRCPGPDLSGAFGNVRREASTLESARNLAEAERGRRKAETGSETRLILERLWRMRTGFNYHRVSEFERGGAKRFDLTLDSSGKLLDAKVAPYAPKPTIKGNYRPKTRLRLPLAEPRDGAVIAVVWGGDNYIDNYHDKNDTYFAYDLAPRALSSATPSSKTEAPCWGLPVLAAASGTVVSASNDIPDIMRLNHPDDEKLRGPGNTVVIDHGNGEFSAYSHMKFGSVTVRAGQKVSTGDTIGQCGSSGSGPNPHLHFQLMDGPNLDSAHGLPIVFSDYFAPFNYVEQGTPKRGDLILPGRAR